MKVDKRAVLVTVFLSNFLNPFSGVSLNIALPSIAKEYTLDAVAMSWASLVYLLGSAMFLIPFGKLADMYGRKRFFLTGTTIFVASSLILGLYPTSQTLIILLALQGFGSAMIMATSTAILVSTYPPRERGSVIGAAVSAVYIGLTLGSYLGGMLTHHYGWRSIFLVNIGVGLLTMILIMTKIKDDPITDTWGKFDFTGSIIFSATLFTLMYGMSKIPTKATTLPIILGITLGSIFLIHESRVKNPVLDINFFKKNRVYSLFNLAALINYTATFSTAFLLSMYLQYIEGLNPQQAGAILMASPVMRAILSPITGKLSDRINPSILVIAGTAVTTLGLASLTLLNTTTQTKYITMSLIVLGTGLSIFVSPNTNLIMGSVPRSHLSVASSTLNTMRLMGQMFSQGIAMSIIALNLGSATIVPKLFPELLSSILDAFQVFLALGICAICISIAGNRIVAQNKNKVKQEI